MRYFVRVNRRTKFIRAYKILKREGEEQNIITRAFIRVMGRFFGVKKGSEDLGD